MKGRYLFATFAFLAAPIVALQALASSGTSVTPWLQEWNGFRLAEDSANQIRTISRSNNIGFEIPRRAITSARQAYASEPLATDALLVLGLAQEDANLQILQSSLELERRNLAIGAILLQRAAQAGDIETVLDQLNILSRIRPEIRRELVTVLTQSLNDEGSVPVIAQALRHNPPWAEDFWRRVPRDEGALINYLALRKSLPAAATIESDAKLIQTLVKTGNFDTAFEFREDHARDPGQTGYPPLDWQLAQGRRKTSTKISANHFSVFIDAGSSGEIVRKLVKLVPGTYRLEYRIVNEQGDAKFYADLECVGSNRAYDRRSLTNGASEWVVEPDSCEYAWLSLAGSAWESTIATRARLDDVTFIRLH
ncbi:hypothetical protein CHH26_13130 [Qipengyuania flava]|uniref:hypothetical protein n=1 Tax=Qipengyuania flava TaxID=192812 RepID=UPI000B8C0617|nr:hypothetical protein [Qipengyuania flava]ASP31064.1 hypothetical protein CHH26_13130 [Qipengyuania flava]